MINTKYNHLEVEENKYDNWVKKGYFKSGDLEKVPFTIVIPPPNVTGNLHLGHAWDTTIQDIIIRYKRLCGYDALWLPGMDHAGIATQAKIDAKLKASGIQPRNISREDWLDHAWEWKETYAANIKRQWAKMGLSLDYSKERFTLDQGLNDAVTKVFIDLYNKGLIYKGERIINWDPQAMTALSNEEVIYKETKGAFYYIKYMIEGSDKYLEVATTRPETLFGDTALAVNPKDERYKDLIGKNVILPIVNKLIKIVGDDYADPDFGTGIVKITPAHDINDFEVGNRHNLERIRCINPDATMNEFAGIYAGLDRFAAREKLVNDLKEQNLLIKIEEIIHNVGYSERTDAMVEPYLSKQWFVKMRPLANRVLDNQKDKENKVEFVPERFEKIMNHWMEITYDWCISRQLWWGHRIPAWYKDEEIYVGINPPSDEWVQDDDVLDTWFSSALWPFSTLGWPNNTEELKRYYPNNVLVTGYDIIPFWVNRMVFQGLEFTNTIPFKECLIHGLIRDKDGRKMSKSLGNGIDPMDVINEYGADSLRYFLTTNTAMGMDLRYDIDKVKSTWNFINKIWNASRFVLISIEEFNISNDKFNDLGHIDKWILNKLNETVKLTRKYMDKYEFNMVGTTLYNFVWNDFCDWYIELSKANMNNTTKSVLLYTLESILKMLHPFMPYVTEEIYLSLPNHKESIMISDYPEYNPKLNFKTDIDNLLELITNLRVFKKDNNIKEFDIVYNDSNKVLILENKAILNKLLKLDESNYLLESSKENSYELILSFTKLIISYNSNIDKEAEKNNLLNEREEIMKSISKRRSLLSNENYISKAPQNIVEMDKEKLKTELEKLEIINKMLGE